jgi:outer membrane receptor protein involved in Fe transport
MYSTTAKLRNFMTARSVSLAFLLAAFATAQTPDTATVQGQITDPSGGVVSAAAVALNNEATGARRLVNTDPAGRYSLAGLSLTGIYRLSVTKPGFGTATPPPLQLRANEAATVNVTLEPEGSRSQVNVFGTVEGLRQDSPQIDTRLSLATIEHTPIPGRKITTLPLLDSAVRPARGTGDLFLNNTLFIVNGAGRRQTPFVIDGATGDDDWGRQSIFTNLPFSAIQEFTVSPNSFSAEFGRSAGGVVNIVTKSGTNVFHGDLVYLFRPGALEASSPGSPLRTEDRDQQVSGSVSGPIVQDRTHFLLSSEYSNQHRDSAISSALAPGVYTGNFQQALFLARVDHQLNSRNTLNGKINFDRFFDTNPADAVGGNALPSAARVFHKRTYTTQLSDLTVVSPAAINELRFQFQLGSPITQFQPAAPTTQFVRPGVSTEGESRAANLINHQYQVVDTFSLTRGLHSLRFGADAIHSSSGGQGTEFGSGYVLGQFTFKTGIPLTRPTSALTIADAARYTQSFGNANYNVSEWLWAVFLQDTWRVAPSFTLNLGLRYERQTFTDDHNNFSPRAGFAYNVLGSSKTVLRGGYGIYYSELRANLGAQFSQSSPTGVFTFTAAPGQQGFPTTLTPFAALPTGAAIPPRDLIIRPGRRSFYNQFFSVSKLSFYPDKLLNPYTQQANLGLERELAGQWFLSADYVYQHTIRIDRTLDLNAPAPFIRTLPGQTRTGAAADATRPITPVNGGYRRIQAVINDGSSLYNALQVRLHKRFGNRLSLLANYTWSHTINTAETDYNSDPNDANLIGRPERATSLLDQRHRAAISGWYQLGWGFTTGTFTTLASSRPYNITTGVDNNGDSTTSDRPVINGAVIGRNAGRGTPTYDAGLFLEREFSIGEHVRVSARAEGSNMFNHSNIVLRQGIYGNLSSGLPDPTVSPSLGQGLAGIANVDPGRQFQFQLRLQF